MIDKRLKIIFFIFLTIIALINLLITIVFSLFPQYGSILDIILAIMFYFNGASIQWFAFYIFFNVKT